MGEKRVFGLDLMRFVAIICVLLAHTVSLVSARRIVNIVCTYNAVIGVELFFVLSGFLIGTIIIKTHTKAPVTNFGSIKEFWIRRWFRTLPNYYLMLIVNLLIFSILYPLPISVNKLWTYVVFLQSAITEEANVFFGIAWSLCVEEWFYLLFPLILFIVQFVVRGKKPSLLTVILIFILFPLIGRYIFSVNSHIKWDAGYRKITFIRLDSIGIGVLFAYIKFYHEKVWDAYRRQCFVLGITLFTALLVYVYYGYIINAAPGTAIENAHTGVFMNTLFFTLLSLSIGLLLPAIYAISVKTETFIHKGVTFISLTSYSLYLLHPIVIILVIKYLPPISGVLTFVEVWIISITLAYLQYTYFEKRMTALREYFSKKKQANTF